MNNVYTAAAPLLYFAKCFGLLPLSFEGHVSRGILVFKWHSVLLPLISAVIPIILFILTLQHKDDLEASTLLLSQAWITQLTVGIAAVVIQFMLQMFLSRKIPRFLECVNSFDQKARKLFR
jgi:7tm Chemosensory receptor